MENKKHKILRIIITGALSVLLLIPSCLWGTRPLYAEGGAPTKQTLGNMLITLLASFGVKTYIGVANSAQWVADNYEQFISTVSGLKSAYQIYEEVQSTYDPSTGKSTLTADAYNSIAQYVRDFMKNYDVVDTSEPVNVGSYKFYGVGTYYDLTGLYELDYNTTGSFRYWHIKVNPYSSSNNTIVRAVYIHYPNSGAYYKYNLVFVGNDYFKYYSGGSNTESSTSTPSTNSSPISGHSGYYAFHYAMDSPKDINIPVINSTETNSGNLYNIAYDYTFGLDAAIGSEISDNIYYQGDQSLNDMVSTTDQNAVFDWSKVAGLDKTLAEILEAVNEIALTDAWDTVNFPVPDAKEPVPSVPVPDNTPIPPWWDNIPELEAPTCPTLSACIVSGARAVSDNITSLMNLHSELAIYTGVGLSLGLALLIIGAFRR